MSKCELLPPSWWSINHCESVFTNFKRLKGPVKESEQVQSAIAQQTFEELFEDLKTYQS